MADPNGVPFTVAPVRADDEKEKSRKESEEEAATKAHQQKEREVRKDDDKKSEDEDLVGLALGLPAVLWIQWSSEILMMYALHSHRAKMISH